MTIRTSVTSTPARLRSFTPVPPATNKLIADAAAFGLKVSQEGHSFVLESAPAPQKAPTPSAALNFVALESAYSTAYKNGDVAFLIGNLDDDWTKSEWNRFYSVAKWLVEKQFRVVMNPVANGEDVYAAAQDDRTKVIIWSSHARQNGEILDASKDVVPADAFMGAKNLRQVIFSACYGDAISERYDTNGKTKEIFWSGTTTSDDLFNYLLSERFDPRTFGENEPEGDVYR